MKGLDLLKQLAEKAGIPADDKDFAAFVASPNFDNVPDSIVSSITGKLMSESEAKVNAGIKGHWTHSIYGGVDKTITDFLPELEFDDASKAEIAAEKETLKKIKLLATKTKQLERAKYEGVKGKEVALLQEVDKLKGEIVAEKEATTRKINEANEKASATILDYAINANISGRNFANKAVPKDANVATALYLLNKGLNEKNIRVVRDDATNGLKLVRKDDTSLPYTENHKEIPFDSFADSILATNKLLDVGNNVSQNNSRQGAPANPQHQTQSVNVDPEIAAHYAKQFAEMNNGHS